MGGYYIYYIYIGLWEFGRMALFEKNLSGSDSRFSGSHFFRSGLAVLFK